VGSGAEGQVVFPAAHAIGAGKHPHRRGANHFQRVHALVPQPAVDRRPEMAAARGKVNAILITPRKDVVAAREMAQAQYNSAVQPFGSLPAFPAIDAGLHS